MVTTITNDNVYSYRGLSTDTKPTTCGNGSYFLEMDTSKEYYFDEASSIWREVNS